MVTKTIRDFSNSRPLDVHRWSDYPEVNRLVDQLMADQFADFTHKKTRNHVKVLLLDLFVCWLEDPEKLLGVGLSNRSYKARSRYNALHISNLSLLNSKGELTRVGYRMEDDIKVRFAKKSNEVI